MKKNFINNGFTLIELLAVIVILAIIALIATPIVLSIINDSKESSGLRSAEMYINSLENSIATSTLNNINLSNGNYNVLENGNICIEYSEDRCISELNIEVNGKVANNGSITIQDGKIENVELIYEDKLIIKDINGNFVYQEPICTLVSDADNSQTITAGDKYECRVKEGVEPYNFYILTTPTEEDNKISLILDRNMYYDKENDIGLLSTESNKGLVAWNSSGQNADGPVTAMDYLHNTTKDWINIPNIVINYEDEGKTGDYGYGKVITRGIITTITKKDGIEVAKYKNLKARLPMKSELSNYSDELNNGYLYSNLDADGGMINYGNIKGIVGYWAFASAVADPTMAARIYFDGHIHGGGVSNNLLYGVRPVITLLKNYIK